MDELSRDDLRDLLLDAAPSDATREAMFAHTFSDRTAGAGAELLPADGWYEADPYGYDDPDVFTSPELDSTDNGDLSDGSGAGYDALAEADVDTLHDTTSGGEGSHDTFHGSDDAEVHDGVHDHDHGTDSEPGTGGDDSLFDTGHGGW